MSSLGNIPEPNYTKLWLGTLLSLGIYSEWTAGSRKAQQDCLEHTKRSLESKINTVRQLLTEVEAIEASNNLHALARLHQIAGQLPSLSSHCQQQAKKIYVYVLDTFKFSFGVAANIFTLGLYGLCRNYFLHKRLVVLNGEVEKIDKEHSRNYNRLTFLICSLKPIFEADALAFPFLVSPHGAQCVYVAELQNQCRKIQREITKIQFDNQRERGKGAAAIQELTQQIGIFQQQVNTLNTEKNQKIANLGQKTQQIRALELQAQNILRDIETVKRAQVLTEDQKNLLEPLPSGFNFNMTPEEITNLFDTKFYDERLKNEKTFTDVFKKAFKVTLDELIALSTPKSAGKAARVNFINTPRYWVEVPNNDPYQRHRYSFHMMMALNIIAKAKVIRNNGKFQANVNEYVELPSPNGQKVLTKEGTQQKWWTMFSGIGPFTPENADEAGDYTKGIDFPNLVLAYEKLSTAGKKHLQSLILEHFLWKNDPDFDAAKAYRGKADDADAELLRSIYDSLKKIGAMFEGDSLKILSKSLWREHAPYDDDTYTSSPIPFNKEVQVCNLMLEREDDYVRWEMPFLTHLTAKVAGHDQRLEQLRATISQLQSTISRLDSGVFRSPQNQEELEKAREALRIANEEIGRMPQEKGLLAKIKKWEGYHRVVFDHMTKERIPQVTKPTVACLNDTACWYKSSHGNLNHGCSWSALMLFLTGPEGTNDDIKQIKSYIAEQLNLEHNINKYNMYTGLAKNLGGLQHTARVGGTEVPLTLEDYQHWLTSSGTGTTAVTYTSKSGQTRVVQLSSVYDIGPGDLTMVADLVAGLPIRIFTHNVRVAFDPKTGAAIPPYKYGNIKTEPHVGITLYNEPGHTYWSLEPIMTPLAGDSQALKEAVSKTNR